MPNSKNQTELQEILAAINEAKAVFLVNYQGLPATQLNDLRRQIRGQQAYMRVVKNTLFSIALQRSTQNIQVDFSDIANTSAAIFTQDPVTPIKTVIKFGKDSNLPSLKVGFYQGRILSKDQLTRLSELPDQKVLQGQVVGMIASPLSRMVGSLNSPLQKLVIALSEIQKQKSH